MGSLGSVTILMSPGTLSSLALCLAWVSQTSASPPTSTTVVCYWRPADWQTWRPYQTSFTCKDIPTSLCHYLVYGAGRLDTDTWSVHSKDAHMDTQLGGLTNVTELKETNPDLKVELALGTPLTVAESFYIMAADPEKRKLFIESSVEFLRKHDMDGLHLHWGGKAAGVTVDTDKKHLTALLKDLKEKFQEENLVITLSIWKILRNNVDMNFDIASVYRYADLVHIHAYGYHGSWEPVTGSMAPLSFSEEEDSSINEYSNVESSWGHLKQKGAHPNKTILVVPFKGSTFLLKDPSKFGKYAPAATPSVEKPKLTWKYDHPLYHELCAQIKSDPGWIQEWDEAGKVPYMHKGDQWISYENTASVAEKVSFVVREKIAGLAADNIGRDDVKGDCSDVTFPLLRTLHRTINITETGNNAVTQSIGMITFAFSLVLFIDI